MHVVTVNMIDKVLESPTNLTQTRFLKCCALLHHLLNHKAPSRTLLPQSSQIYYRICKYLEMEAIEKLFSFLKFKKYFAVT